MIESEFSQAFLNARITRTQAAEFLGVDTSTIRRMLNGTTKPKRAYVQALNMLAGFAPVMSRRDKAFKNWRFHSGKLWTDEGMGFTAAEIRSIWHVDQLLQGQKKQIRELETLVADLQALVDELQPVPETLPDNVIAFPAARSGGNAA